MELLVCVIYNPRQMISLRSFKRVLGYAAGIAAVAAAIFALTPFTFSVSGRGVAVGSVLLLAVVLTAIFWGVGPGLLAAIVASISLEVFFFYTDPDDMMSDRIVGIAAFLLTSLLVGRLSAKARRSTQEAANLRLIFDQASELEATKRNERFKSVLLDTVTHDVRTPLTSIKAAATTLLEWNQSALPKESRDSHNLLETIVHESDRLDRFIEGMIEMAKTSATGPSGLTAQIAPLEEIFAVALSRADDLLRDHHVAVKCDDDVYVRGNTRAISQVLFSLLQNAARYSPPHTTISITATPREGDLVDVAVEDEGPGIPHGLREKIFEKFVRGQDSNVPDAKNRGMGIGLAIAQGIISANGGTIRVEDRLDGRAGARFAFTLPVRPQSEATETKGAPIT